MIKRVTIAILALGLSLPAVVTAQGFGFKRVVRIPVLPIDSNTFETVVNDGAGGSLMWCAAARFTRHYLRQRGGDLFVKKPVGPSATFPGRKSVIFTTQPIPNSVTSYTEGIATPGQRFSQAHGYSICRTQERQHYYVRVQVVGQ